MIKIRHLGDITKIDGSTAPIVDIVTFGAPCQDLSVAGKRAGMKHEAVGDDETTRSGLFFEAIRIIKEMREHDRQLRMQGADDIGRPLRPRYTVYENVPGAFSSNKGEDFRAVLEETVKVADKDAVIPGPEGKWPPCGCIVGEGPDGPYSVAWRVHDAQFHGVPQRRKRLAVLADYNGLTAPKILFEYGGETDESHNNETV